MLEDDTCAQDSNNNAVPTGLDYYDTLKRFGMVSLYCVLSYIPVCSIQATSYFNGTIAVCADALQLRNAKTL